MQIVPVNDDEELVAGHKYGFYYGGIPMVGIHKPGKGNEIHFPTFSVDSKLYTAKRSEVATKVVNDE